jgi:hypothetical protein
MKNKKNVKTGETELQRSQTPARGLKIKTNVKAGDGTTEPAPKKITTNHNQTITRSLRIKTSVKPGVVDPKF